MFCTGLLHILRCGSFQPGRSHGFAPTSPRPTNHTPITLTYYNVRSRLCILVTQSLWHCTISSILNMLAMLRLFHFCGRLFRPHFQRMRLSSYLCTCHWHNPVRKFASSHHSWKFPVSSWDAPGSAFRLFCLGMLQCSFCEAALKTLVVEHLALRVHVSVHTRIMIWP